MNWDDIKKRGSHYHKTTGVEPIDLYKDGEMLRDFALANIMKYAFRNRRQARRQVKISDIIKIKHYADMILVAYGVKGEAGE
uniref:Putative structural protein n=1 Tax=viral metagenome TaxID=1070528 RepID=A0A6H1ZIQ8_9ZZZZ